MPCSHIQQENDHGDAVHPTAFEAFGKKLVFAVFRIPSDRKSSPQDLLAYPVTRTPAPPEEQKGRRVGMLEYWAPSRNICG